jgi:transposase-like protein
LSARTIILSLTASTSGKNSVSETFAALTVQSVTSPPMVVKSWQNNWARVIPMFSFAPEIRRAIYTTNTIESLNMTLRKIIKNRAMFPSDEAVFKILYLALRNISKRWTMPIANWSGAMNQFAIIFENRLPNSGFQNNSFK